MVGGAAGGVHWAGRGCPRYAQVRGTELANLAGFQPALFPIVLRLLCPLFFRALCCAARGSAKDLSQKISIPCGDRTVGCGRSRPCLSLYLHCSLQPNAAVRQPCSGQTPWWHEINREIQGVGAIPRPPRRCGAPLPPLRRFPSRRDRGISNDLQADAARWSRRPVASVPHKITVRQRLAPRSPACR